jgi:hypothetical protein
MIISIIRNWLLCGHLITALFEVAARTRLAVILPDVFSKAPIKVQNFAEFSSSMELIEQWCLLAREVTKKFGNCGSLCELAATTKKTLQVRRANTPYCKNLLTTNARIFKFGKILPKKVDGIFHTDFIIKREFYNNIRNSLEFETLANITMLRATFPKSLEIVQHKIKRDLLTNETLD